MKDIINIFRRNISKRKLRKTDIAFLKSQSGTPLVINKEILKPGTFVSNRKLTVRACKQQVMCYNSFRNLDEHNYVVFGVNPSLQDYDNAWLDSKTGVWYPHNTDNEPIEVKHPILNHIAEYFG